MAAVTWRCPVPGCEVTAAGRGNCGAHLVRLEAVAAPAAPAAPAPDGRTGVAGSGAVSVSGAAGSRRAAGSGGAAAPRLAIVLGGLRTEVPPDGLLVGRALPPWRDVPAVRALTQVSRATQARLFWRGGALYVEDAGSTNGTFLAGRRLTGPAVLEPGADLRFGLDVTVRVVELDAIGMAVNQEG